MKQSKGERAALLAAWEAKPVVQELAEQVEAFAWRNNLRFDADGLSKALEFASQFVASQPEWPATGIAIG